MESLHKRKGEIDPEKTEIVIKLEESVNEEAKDEIESTKEIKSNSFVSILISIMSFIGIIVGVIYVIYLKKEGAG